MSIAVTFHFFRLSGYLSPFYPNNQKRASKNMRVSLNCSRLLAKFSKIVVKKSKIRVNFSKKLGIFRNFSNCAKLHKLFVKNKLQNNLRAFVQIPFMRKTFITPLFSQKNKDLQQKQERKQKTYAIFATCSSTLGFMLKIGIIYFHFPVKFIRTCLSRRSPQDEDGAWHMDVIASPLGAWQSRLKSELSNPRGGLQSTSQKCEEGLNSSLKSQI